MSIIFKNRIIATNAVLLLKPKQL